MILSKSRGPAKEQTGKKKGEEDKASDLEGYIAKRDYLGAITLIKFGLSRRGSQKTKELEWLAYCYFHYGDHANALQTYEKLLSEPGPNPLYRLYSAACSYYMGLYKEAIEAAEQAPAGSLRARILLHSWNKLGDESKLVEAHQELGDSLEEQLSLAAIHFFRSNYQEATDIYKRLLLENRDYPALNVYVALCYSKLEYYDVSLEILAIYLNQFPDSATALNLKACNHFKLYNGKAAENELKGLGMKTNEAHLDNDLIRHNLVVFRSGEHALQTLPPLGDIPREARLNLAVYHLRNADIDEAARVLDKLKPSTPPEYMLKAVVHASVGQSTGSAKDLKTAQHYYQLVGSSSSECDTIPGRQCMASCFFLVKQFEDVLVFLNSVKTYFYTDDDFNWNYGIAQAAVGQFKEAEKTLLNVQSEKYRGEYCYIVWLARSHIMNGKPRQAWELYLRMETTDESFNLLQVIANDCYRVGSFFISAKAFDVLDRLDPNPEYWEGKRGACIGVFQLVIAGKEPSDTLREVIAMLRNKSNPQVEMMVKLMKKWCRENDIKCT